LVFQANSKSSKIQQSPAEPEQRKSKEKAWILLDFLVRNELFQGVAPTPQGIFSFFRIPWLKLILVMYFVAPTAAGFGAALLALCRLVGSWRQRSTGFDFPEAIARKTGEPNPGAQTAAPRLPSNRPRAEECPPGSASV
jgi:hypothetical protein